MEQGNNTKTIDIVFNGDQVGGSTQVSETIDITDIIEHSNQVWKELARLKKEVDYGSCTELLKLVGCIKDGKVVNFKNVDFFISTYVLSVPHVYHEIRAGFEGLKSRMESCQNYDSEQFDDIKESLYTVSDIDFRIEVCDELVSRRSMPQTTTNLLRDYLHLFMMVKHLEQALLGRINGGYH